MNRLIMIARNNMKKQKGDMITFFLLTFIAAFLIFDCASTILGLTKVLDSRFEAVNGAHIMIYNTDTEAERESARKALEENPYVIDVEQTPVLQFMTEYRKSDEKEFVPYTFFVENFNQEKRIMKIGTPSKEYQKDDILIPYNLKGRFSIGDVFQLKFGEDVYDFHVAGYLEDPYFCSTLNITAYYVSMSQEMMDRLSEDHSLIVRQTMASKGIADISAMPEGYTTEDLEDAISEVYKAALREFSEKNPGEDYNYYMMINWDMMRGGSQFFPMVVMAVILLFAILILVISLVIISFSIKNFIQRNMKNTGILEASGYTVLELRFALALQILLVAAFGAAVGIGAAALTFGSFGDIVSSVLGLRWNQPVNALAAVLTFAGILLVMLAMSAIISNAYNRVTVLDALRGGISNHNFKKNFFPFEKTNLPLPITLAMKETFGNLGRNLGIAFVSMVLVISTLTGFGMVDTFAKDSGGLRKMMAFETCTDLVTAPKSDRDLSEELRALPDVDNVLVTLGFEPTLLYGDKKDAIFTYVDDDVKNTRYTNLLEGRYPENENEILVTLGVAKDLGLGTGDVVTIEYAGNESEYIITGINQRMERMGRTIIMRLDGAKKLLLGDVTGSYQYYVTGKDGVTYEQLKAKIEGFAEDEGLELRQFDNEAEMLSTIATVVAALKAICLIITAITIVIVIFVESLVIRAKIARERRGMGISKALGQTNGGLICQIMISNLPAIIVGAIFGGLLAPMAGSSLIKAVFSLFALKKVDFGISIPWVVITIVGIAVVAILTSAAEGLRVRRLRPVAMITEE
ncbi:MAG: ABC transporter permease [Lachnospiraceae bacterium]|nr:ABC transporter permease [Lachnospiraceae bacterium]